jgi:hypothetical protein
MANFDVQIQALSGTATQTEMDQWMMDGVREITNILPPYLKEYCYSKQTFTSAAANSEAETMITGQLGSVYAGSVECRRIKPMDKHKASSSSSIEFASATDPVYYIEGNKINILPASSSGVYYVIANPSIDASAVSAIDNFPNEAEYLVVLYAAIKVLQNKMNEMGGISDLSISASAPTIPSDPSISSPGVATIAKPDISGNAPTYTKPSLDSSTNMLTEMEAGTLGSAELDFEQWFNIAGQYIEDEEDTELAQAQLQKIQTYLQAFSQDIQNELNEFNKENEIYKANIQAEILKHQTDAAEAQKEGDLTLQAAIQDYSLELQLYQQELALYQQNVNKEVTQYRTNLEQYGIEYQWLQSQQLKLQQDYDKGIQMLVAQGIPQPSQKEAR